MTIVQALFKRNMLLCWLAMLTALAPASRHAPSLQAQQAGTQALDDVVYLKDGSIIRGILIEQRPGESVLIRTHDGNQFRYQMSQIEKLTKESPIRPSAPAPTAVQPTAPALPPFTDPKSPGLAAVLSILVPGVGQFYNGDWFGGLTFMFLQWESYAFYAKGLLEPDCVNQLKCSKANTWLTVAIVVYGWNILDAVLGAQQVNREARAKYGVSLVPWIDIHRAPGSEVGSYAAQRVTSGASTNLHLGLVRVRW